MAKLPPYRSLVCRGEHRLDFLGTRSATEHFLYGPLLDEDRTPYCQSCPFRSECCPRAETGRHVVLSSTLLPHLSTDDPPMAKRNAKMMTRRPAVERVIERLKKDLGDDELTKRGNAAFQARLDKTLITFHLLLRQ